MITDIKMKYEIMNLMKILEKTSRFPIQQFEDYIFTKRTSDNLFNLNFLLIYYESSQFDFQVIL